MSDIERLPDGKFPAGVSGNKNGRPKGTAAKAAKKGLDKKLKQLGPEAFDIAKEIMLEARAEGDNSTALKAAIWIGDKYYQLTLHNEKLEIAEQKDKQKSSDDDDEESGDSGFVPVAFSATMQK